MNPTLPLLHETAPQGRIAAFPKDDNDYTRAFYRVVEASGFRVDAGSFTIRWILANAGRYEAFHFHWPSYHYASSGRAPRRMLYLVRYVALLLVIRAHRGRIFWTAHNLYPHDGGGDQAFHRWGRWWIVALSEAIFVHGANARRIVAEAFPHSRGKLHVIPHGHWDGYYPNDMDRATARRLLGVPELAYLYVFVGVCREYKNLEVLAGAFARIGSGDAMLLIAGQFTDATYKRRVDAAIAPIADRARLVAEFVPPERLQVFLAAGDCVVLPYKEVLTSGAAILAMSFGRPVVAPSKGALIDIVPPCAGVLYEPDDPGGLETAMRRIAKRRFDSAEIRALVARFDWRDAARVFTDVIVDPNPAAQPPLRARPAPRV